MALISWKGHCTCDDWQRMPEEHICLFISDSIFYVCFMFDTDVYYQLWHWCWHLVQAWFRPITAVSCVVVVCMLCCAMMCQAMWCCVMYCHVVLSYVKPCHAIPYHAMPCHSKWNVSKMMAKRMSYTNICKWNPSTNHIFQDIIYTSNGYRGRSRLTIHSFSIARNVTG